MIIELKQREENNNIIRNSSKSDILTFNNCRMLMGNRPVLLRVPWLTKFEIRNFVETSSRSHFFEHIFKIHFYILVFSISTTCRYESKYVEGHIKNSFCNYKNFWQTSKGRVKNVPIWRPHYVQRKSRKSQFNALYRIYYYNIFKA